MAEDSPQDTTSENSDKQDDRTSWSRTLDAASLPVHALIENSPPEVAETLTQKVALALQSALDHSQALRDTEQLEERLRKARAYPGSDTAGYESHLLTIEESVTSHCAEVKKRTVLGSCLTGFAGAVGQVADVPAFYLYAVHSMQEIAISYGFDPRQEREQKFLLHLLRIAHTPGRKSRYLEVDRLDSLDLDGDLATIPEISHALTGRGMMVLSQQLLKLLFRRKAMALVPVFGAVVNAGINNHLMNAILDVTQRSYRRRFVKRAQLIAADRAK